MPIDYSKLRNITARELINASPTTASLIPALTGVTAATDILMDEG